MGNKVECSKSINYYVWEDATFIEDYSLWYSNETTSSYFQTPKKEKGPMKSCICVQVCVYPPRVTYALRTVRSPYVEFQVHIVKHNLVLRKRELNREDFVSGTCRDRAMIEMGGHLGTADRARNMCIP